MKKTMLAAAMVAAMGTTAIAEAGTVGLTGVWSGTYSFAMFSPGGGPVGAPTAPQSWSFDFDNNTVSISNTTTFYASVWTAHSVTATDNGDGTYGNTTAQGANMLFNWSVNSDIPVAAKWDITASGNGIGDTATVASVSSTILASSAVFPGFHPTFTGSLTKVSGAAAVPVPAAAYLMGSGLIGLVGVARRRNKKA